MCAVGFFESSRGQLVDRLTQRWVRATGRRLDLAGYPWLDGPVGGPEVIGDEWVRAEAERLGGRVVSNGEAAGLLTSMDALAGEAFDPRYVSPEVRDFYEHTARWRFELWSQWSPIAWPFGWLLGKVFAHRLQQLCLPLRPLDVAHGVSSRVIHVVDEAGGSLGAAWLRTLRATGGTIYSGWYGTMTLPGQRQPSVRVVFPLPQREPRRLSAPRADEQGHPPDLPAWSLRR